MKLNKKDARKCIEDARLLGRSDQEIYYDLSSRYEDRRAIALLIMNTPTDKLKKEFKNHNLALLVLLGLNVVSKILLFINLVKSSNKTWLIFFLAVALLLDIYFFIQVRRYNTRIYYLIAFFAVFGIYNLFQSLPVQNENIVIFIFNFIFWGVVALLSFYIGYNLYQNYNMKDLKVDEKGDYILTGFEEEIK